MDNTSDNVGAALKKALEHSSSGLLAGDAELRQYAVQPVLRALGWDVSDPSQWRIHREGPLGAVLGSDEGAVVLVGNKKYWPAGGTAPLGVELLVLTDGEVWDVHLVRKGTIVGAISVMDSSPAESFGRVCSDMVRFLSRDAVMSGASHRAAGDEFLQLGSLEDISGAWAHLLREAEGPIVEALADRTEKRAGRRPKADDVADFLKSHTDAAKKPAVTTVSGFVYRGAEYPSVSGRTSLLRLIEVLGRRDPGLIERYSEFSGNGEQLKRPRVIRAGHPVLGNPKRKSWYSKLDNEGSWWVMVNLSTQGVLSNMAIVTDLAGMVWERDVIPLVAEKR